MPTGQLTTVTCEVIGRPKDSKFEPGKQYRPVKFITATGGDFWKSYKLDADELTWLEKGKTYQAVGRDDGDWTIIEPDQRDADRTVDRLAAHLELEPDPVVAAPTAPPAKPTQPKQGLSPDTKRAIADYVTEMGDLYAYCYQQAQTKLDGAPPAAIQGMASTLFISATKKFKLQG